MVILQNLNFPAPEVPPGFETLNPQTSDATAAAITITPAVTVSAATSTAGTITTTTAEATTTTAGGADQNGVLQVQTLFHIMEPGLQRWRTPRIKRPPALYVSPAPSAAAAPPRKRGRPRKVKSSPGAGRRGRPPKTRLASLFDTEETVVIPHGERSKNDNRNMTSDQGFCQEMLHRFYNDMQCFANQNSVEKNVVCTLKAIGKKHGDFTKNCTLQSDHIKNLILIGICNVVQELQSKQLEDLDAGSLDSYSSTVRDAVSMNMDVKWLRNRLDELKDYVVLTSETKGLQNERKALLMDIDGKKKELLLQRVELERLKSEVRDVEEQVARGDVMLEELNKKYSDHMARMSRFLLVNLMDGLV